MGITVKAEEHQSILFHAESKVIADQWRSMFSGFTVSDGTLPLSDWPVDPNQQVFLLVQLNHPLLCINEIRQLIKCSLNLIVISSHSSVEEGIALFQEGVKGYLPDDFPLKEYPQVISTVSKGNVWLGQHIMSALIKNVAPNESTNLDWQQGLTNREKEVAFAILEGKSNREIAEQLFITDRTVKAHVRSLLIKFRVKDRLSLVLKIQSIRHPNHSR